MNHKYIGNKNINLNIMDKNVMNKKIRIGIL